MASRAERIEDAARALLAASSRIEAETMCVVPRRLVDALRAALAAQPAQAGPAIGTKARLRCPWRECRHEWDGEIGLHVYCPKCRCSLTINGPEVVSAPAQAGEAVARAVRETALVNFNTPQEYDVACAQRAACEMAALNCIDAMRPGGAS